MVILIILAAGVIYYFSRPHLYGNDEKSIVKVIQSIKGYETGSIEILDIKDIEGTRYASFLLNNNPGFITFQKDTRGNYKWQHIEKHEGDTVSSFLVRSQDGMKLVIVTNEENEIAKFQVDVNGTLLEQELKPNISSAVWLDIPPSKDKQYNFKYQYFDKDGKIISPS